MRITIYNVRDEVLDEWLTDCYNRGGEVKFILPFSTKQKRDSALHDVVIWKILVQWPEE